MSGAPLEFVPSASREDAARASYYGLLARLFYAAPDAQLLGEMLHAERMAENATERSARGDALAEAWNALLDACRKAFPVLLEQEHTELFVGTGKAEVTPYLSFYVLRHESDTPLAELRGELIRLGLSRRADSAEPEDHVAAILEVMRHLVAVQQRDLDEQRKFFDRFLYRGAMGLCDAIDTSEKARFYRHVASFTRAFLEIEQASFELY